MGFYVFFNQGNQPVWFNVNQRGFDIIFLKTNQFLIEIT